MTVIFAEPGGDATGGLQFYLGSVGTVTVTTNQPRTGARSIEYATGAGGAEAHCYKDAVLADAGRRVSFSFRFDTLPGTLATVWEAFTAAAAPIFWLNLKSDGLLQLATTGLSIDGTTVLSTSQTYHLAVCYTITSTTVNEFRVYLNGILEITWSNQTLPTTVTSLSMWG
jgi:hypothetical protein